MNPHDEAVLESALGDHRPDDEIEDDEQEDEIVRAKWTIDGATTLAEAAAKARAFAAHLHGLHDQGYVLRQPVADDYGFYYKP